MLALTVQQPWADAIASGLKPVENRKWAPRMDVYGQDLAIHAARAVSAESNGHSLARYRKVAGHAARPIEDMPLAAVVAVVRLVGAVNVESRRVLGNLSEARIAEVLSSPWTYGRWALVLDHVRRLATPVPCRGALMLWRLPVEVARQVSHTTVVDALQARGL
jgi:hypothetical protein